MLKVQISYKLLPSPEGVPTSRMPVQTLRIDTLGTKTAFDTRADDITEHILTALQRFFNKAGYRTERKHVPQSHGLKKADLWIKDFQLEGIRNVIIDVSLRHEFHGSCTNLINKGEPSNPDANGPLDAAKEELDYNYQQLQRAQLFLLAQGESAGTSSACSTVAYCPADDDIFYLFLQKQKSAQSYIPQWY